MTLRLLTYGVGAILVAILAIGVTFWLRVRPIRFDSREALRDLFVKLLRTNQPGTTLFIRARRGPTSLKFMLRRESPSVGGSLVLLFPRAPWSAPYDSDLCAEARRRGLHLWEEEPGPHQRLPMLHVDLGDDVETVVDFSLFVLRDLYGLSNLASEANAYPLIRP